MLARGIQPNTLVRDEPLTLPPIGGVTNRTRPEDYWTPKNYEGGSFGIVTLRKALENSRNLATANLLGSGGIDATPQLSLDRICALALEAQIYKDCSRYYPFVLGAQPVRPIDLAAFFAAVANEGVRPTPHAIEAIEQDGKVVYRHPTESAMVRVASADGVSFYQLKSILQGVLQRGTAARMASLAPYVAGKTGTTDNENDAWFVGFTNEVTVAVWIGYDNSDGRRRTLGHGATGGSVAVPIFEQIIQAAWTHHAPRTQLNGPSAATRKFLVSARVVDPREHDNYDQYGNPVPPRANAGVVEYLRRGPDGRPVDTQYRLVSRNDYAVVHDLEPRDPRREGFFGFFIWRAICTLGKWPTRTAVYRRSPRRTVRRRPAAAAAGMGRTTGPIGIDGHEGTQGRLGGGHACGWRSKCGPGGISAERGGRACRDVGRANEAADNSFADRPGEDLVDPAVGFIQYQIWAKARPVHRRFLSLYPGYTEPNTDLIIDGTKRSFANTCICTSPRRGWCCLARLLRLT